MRALNCPIVALGLACIHASLYAQDAPPIVDAQPLDVDASISAVTLYPGRAAVTRHTSVSLHSGAFDLRFNNLPETIQSDTLQARTDSGLRVLSVEYEQRAVADVATSPAVVELDSRIKSLMQSLRAMTDERELIKSQDEFLAALTIRTTSDAAAAGGTAKLDLDAVKNQMEFITAERKRLQVERAALDTEQPKIEAELAAAKANRDAAVGRGSVARTAVVSVVAPDTFNGEVALTYLVANATWEPAYNIRAAGDLSSVQIEYDAMLTQRTGEDWDDVRLTLSTATPTIAANPPAISPFFVDIWRPEQLARGRGGESRAAPATDVEGFRRVEIDRDAAASLERLAEDAQVAGNGPAVTFELPRAVTVKTNVDRQQRTRIAAIDSSATFVHVATPLLTEAVYLRGDLVNSSAYQLLTGRASIFVGQDYIGPTSLGSVAPGGQMQLHFGIDNSVKARRTLISKTTENTGLLSGGRRTSYDYRITIDNGSGRDITLEMWDRIPVSRHEDIQIQLIEPNVRLADDQHYITEQRPQGLLKWWLTVPATARDRNPMLVTYGVRIDRAKDVQTTPLPE